MSDLLAYHFVTTSVTNATLDTPAHTIVRTALNSSDSVNLGGESFF